MAFIDLKGNFEREIPTKRNGKVCRYLVQYHLTGIQVRWSLTAWVGETRIAKNFALIDLAKVSEEQLIAFLDDAAKAILRNAIFPNLRLPRSYTRKGQAVEPPSSANVDDNQATLSQ